MTSYRIGADIGGTFTDLVLMDASGTTFEIGKILTTPEEPEKAVEQGVQQLLDSTGVAADDVSHVVHGTTLLTNALIERKGARTALVTTKGYRDAIEIGREHRYDMYDLFMERPAPLAPRRHRFELDERVLADGSVEKPLDDEDVTRLLDILREERIAALAVCLMHSYRNPVHEKRVGELVRRHAPELACSLSCEVVPEIREYERSSTTLVNVYVQALAERYLASLEARLRKLGLTGSLFVMQSNGGVCDVSTATRFPVRLVESGPAAGALAAAHYGATMSAPSLLSFDMGGTTAKASIIDDGEPLIALEFEVDRRYRFKKGSGLPVKVPVVEMIEIGAGGGSIARIDGLGRLTVGPDSAGADPGPACYGRGGVAPTVTDADLVLGYLDPSFFLGGKLPLHREAAERFIRQTVAEPLGMKVAEAAWGIHRVVNETMASAARIHAVERGKDAARLPLFAFGGAGPVHAYRVAQILRAPSVVFPLAAGVTSAVGLLAAPLAFDFVRTLREGLEAMDWERINEAFADMERQGREVLGRTIAKEDIRFRRFAEMRYRLQGHDIRVPMPEGVFAPGSEVAMRRGFDDVYASLYGRVQPELPIDVVNWRVIAEGPRPDIALPAASGAARADGSGAKGQRAAYMPEADAFVDTVVYDRYALVDGQRFEGPAIVEERESTVVIGSGARARIDGSQLIVDLPKD